MSYIFDALQRSEGERGELDLPAPSEATQLLRNAERRAASRWETAVRTKKAAVLEASENGTTVGLLTVPAEMLAEAALAPPAQAPKDSTPANNDEEVFSEFQTLEGPRPAQNRLVCFSDDQNLAAEAFRLLAVRLQHLRRDRPLKKVLITSTIPQEGKSMVAANLACTLALKTQEKVLLVEGDLRRPALSQEFGLGRNPGLSECLQGDRVLAKCIYLVQGAGLWILPSGSTDSNALELLQSGRMSELMKQVTTWFDWIIIDSPPVLPLADTSVWSRLADGILLVTRQGTTDKRQLKRGLEGIESNKLIGALLNCAKVCTHNDYYYQPSASRTAESRGE